MSKIAFVFPGQGAQYVGMGKSLYDNYPEAVAVFDQASEALGYDVADLIFNGTEEDLKRTETTQPTILTMSVAALKVLESKGIQADYAAGLSLGEYAALIAAGAMDFKEGVRLVRNRGRYMQEAVPAGVGAMAAILGLEDHLVEQACRESESYGVVQAANYNCPNQLVIAGNAEAVEKAVERCKALGSKKAVLLPVSAPFHTSLLAPAGIQLEPELNALSIGSFAFPVVTNVTGDFYTGADSVVQNLKAQVSQPVRWVSCVDTLVSEGVTTYIEIGPGNALSKFIKKIAKDVQILSVEDVESLEKTLEALKREVL
jgi:[acyl-carrier-protein] S-malonyltransferase